MSSHLWDTLEKTLLLNDLVFRDFRYTHNIDFQSFFLWFVIKNRVKRINKWYISKIFHGKIVQVKVKKMVQTEGKHFQMEKSWRTHIFYVNTTLFLLVMNYWIDLDSWLVQKFSKHCFFKDISNSFNRVTTLKCLI